MTQPDLHVTVLGVDSGVPWVAVDNVAALWKQFRDSPDPETRNALVLRYGFLVDRIARKISATMPVDYEDLRSEGVFGLIDAIEKFDPVHKVRFESYAATRIRGAIIDSVRGADWVPRSVRSRNSQVAAAEARAAHELGRTPTIEEVSRYAGVSPSEIGSGYNDSRAHLVIDSHADMPIVSRDEGPDHHVDLDGLRRMLTSSLRMFGDRERTLFALYYYEGLTLSEIGVVLGVTEARVCQIHTKAMRELCESVAPR